MIPPFDHNGCLPEGIYDCAVEEVSKRFGSFQSSDWRARLWAKFTEFLREAKACGLIEAVLLDGSFVTAKPDPNDIDLILIVPGNHDFSADFQPSEYNVLSKRQVSRRFGFDLLVARAESEEYRRYVEFFQQVRLEPGRKKGILRITL